MIVLNVDIGSGTVRMHVDTYRIRSKVVSNIGGNSSTNGYPSPPSGDISQKASPLSDAMALFNLDLSQLILAFVLALPLAYFFTTFKSSKPLPDESEEPYSTRPQKNTMAAPTPGGLTSPLFHLQAPKLDLYTQEELKQYDGTGPDGKIYVAVKGTVFDVTSKKEMYGPGAAYHVFAGKDGSKGLGLSSIKVEDAVPDYSTLDEGSLKTLDGWYEFYQKRYNVMGTVQDLPAAVSRF